MLNTFYLIRHAHPKQNTGIAYDRLPGPPLDDEGRAEAQRAAVYLALCGLEHLYVSPLDRTRETAEIIAAASGTPISIETALAEHRSDEKFEAVEKRAAAFFAAIENGPHRTLGVVTHGSPVRALLGLLSKGKLDLAKYNFAGGNPVPTAGIWRAERAETAWQLELVFEPQALKT